MPTSTSFNTATMEPEVDPEAQARVNAILHPHGKTDPAATPPPNAAPAATEAPKASRMTVAKILQGYQEKEKVFTADIGKIDSIIASYQKKRDETAFRLSVLQEMIAEINSDKG